jgi:enamine deaminase RidA (YjgF/YER057c/UK114 family)
MDFTNVMRLNIYTVDMQAIMASHDHMVARLRAKGCRHTGTLLGVSGLAAPGALLEMEVTAVA